MRIVPRDFYIILLDGEVIAPNDFDIFMNYWTAQSVEVLLKIIRPQNEVVQQKANLVDWEPPIDGDNHE